MQVVIDIPEKTYEIAKQDLWKWPADDVYNAIKNGILLPQGHGRIADMDAAIKCIKECEGEDAIWAIALIDWACGKRTLIEADKGGEVVCQI